MTGGSGTYGGQENTLGLTPGGGWGGSGALPNRFHYSREQRACQKSALKNTINTGMFLAGGGAVVAVYRGAYIGGKGVQGMAFGTRAVAGQVTVGGVVSSLLTVDDWAEFANQCRSVSPIAPVGY